MTRVYVDVMCDLFHYGHVGFFEQARRLGDELVVGVCSDECGESYKRRPVLTVEERCRVVAACGLVDEVVANPPAPITEAFIREHAIDLVVHGDDYDPAAIQRWYGEAIRLGIFRTVPHTDGISTSEIIERIRARLATDDL